MRSSCRPGLVGLLFIACGASPSATPSPAAPTEPPAAPAPSPAASDSASPAPAASSPAPAASTSAATAASSKQPAPSASVDSAHAARLAALAEAADFAMIGCVHTGGSTDPCPDALPQQGPGGLGASETKPLPATNGKSKATMREGAVSVNGRLPPEVIKRIARQNFGRIRLCYESALKKKPKLSGRVATKFVIDQSGAVTTAQDNGSDLPDAQAVACIVASFGKLSFPQPEGGIVTVVFPLVFSAD